MLQKISLIQYANTIKTKPNKHFGKTLANKHRIETFIDNICKKKLA